VTTAKLPLELSVFNEDDLCSTCVSREKAHPDYASALAAEKEAIRKHNHTTKGTPVHFRGVGLPAELVVIK